MTGFGNVGDWVLEVVKKEARKSIRRFFSALGKWLREKVTSMRHKQRLEQSKRKLREHKLYLQGLVSLHQQELLSEGQEGFDEDHIHAKKQVSQQEEQRLHLEVYFLDEEIVASHYQLLKSGRLSEKRMAKQERNELLRDYFLSYCLRCVREGFKDETLEEVVVDLVYEDEVGLSSRVVSMTCSRETLVTLAIQAPIARVVKDLNVAMDFGIRRGFRSIESLW